METGEGDTSEVPYRHIVAFSSLAVGVPWVVLVVQAFRAEYIEWGPHFVAVGYTLLAGTVWVLLFSFASVVAALTRWLQPPWLRALGAVVLVAGGAVVGYQRLPVGI